MEPTRDEIAVKGLQNLHRLFGRKKKKLGIFFKLHPWGGSQQEIGL
jgi:hypothetical protein